MDFENFTNILPAHDDHADDDHDHGALVPKITAMCVLFVASTVIGLLPFKLSTWFKWNVEPNAKAGTLVSSLLSFGGGVLLATTFLHLQPEVAHIIEDLQNDERMTKFSFSLAPFLMCCGFFIIFLVEELVHYYIECSSKKDADAGAFQRGLHARESVLLRRKQNGNLGSVSTAELIANDIESQKNETKNNNVPKQQNSHVHEHNHNHSHLAIAGNDDSLVSNLKGLLIVLALSVHELFEGLAVGLEETADGAWYFFGAVAAHKLVIAFCIGVELLVIRTKLWLSVIYVITFAIVSPIGIGIGILLSESNNHEAFAVTSVILQGLASGTLLYVIFFEVLSKERTGLVQYVAVLLGFFLMFGLQQLTGHEHNHGGHDHDDHDDHEHDHVHQMVNLGQQLLADSKQLLSHEH